MPAMFRARKPLRVEQSLRPPVLGSCPIFSVRSAAHLFYQRYLFGVFESASRLESKRGVGCFSELIRWVFFIHSGQFRRIFLDLDIEYKSVANFCVRGLWGVGAQSSPI
tara:strand:+ start:367 stop:693 length:327 start_codon:yes stop_codon:yes gene_type:complete